MWDIEVPFSSTVMYVLDSSALSGETSDLWRL
jgi:hypothetical protein